jgi:F0F1-type ATP synthase assembly protein I
MAEISGNRGGGRPAPPNPAQYAGLGFTFAVAVVLFTLGGNWVDGRFGTGPWGVLVGVAAGFALGFLWMIRRLAPVPRDRGREER